MTLLFILCIPALAGILCFASGQERRAAPRWLSLVALTIDLVLTVRLWATTGFGSGGGRKNIEAQWPWIPQFGTSVHLYVDGISLLLILLTLVLGVFAVITSWNRVASRQGAYFFNVMLTLSATIGVFMAADLFLFYFLWELMIIPMYFIIALWGGPKRSRAALQFFLFTQLAGFCMLLSIVGVYFIHGRATGVYSFDFAAVLYNGLNGQAAWLLPLGFFLAFAVKMGIVPFHGWLPDAYQQAPFAGGLLLSGIMAKTGAYGLIRIVMPYFHGSPVMVHCAMTLAVATILYGAGMAFSQQNLLRFIAYGSISHMGFALLGIVTWGQLSLQGVVIQMLAHGLIVAGLFMAAAQLESRTGQSSASAMGGLWSDMPRFGGIFLIFALGAAGLPGLPNFIGEFLILLDAFRVSKAAAVASAAGGIVMISSMLWMVQQIFQGNKKSSTFYKDFSLRESTPFFVLIIVMLWLGMFPALFMKTGGPAIDTLLTSSKTTHAAVVNPGALR